MHKGRSTPTKLTANGIMLRTATGTVKASDRLQMAYTRMNVKTEAQSGQSQEQERVEKSHAQ